MSARSCKKFVEEGVDFRGVLTSAGVGLGVGLGVVGKTFFLPLLRLEAKRLHFGRNRLEDSINKCSKSNKENKLLHSNLSSQWSSFADFPAWKHQWLHCQRFQGCHGNFPRSSSASRKIHGDRLSTE